jgi:hypothetical protein
MLNDEDRPGNNLNEATPPARPGLRGLKRQENRFTGKARTAPRGSESRIGDDETHRRLQEARNRASHSTENLVRRVLGPEWARD